MGSSWAALAAAPVKLEGSQTPVKLACVGDSITQGVGAERGKSWPDQLHEMFLGKWEIKNFGVSGTTLMKRGDSPYQKTKQFEDAKKFNPDVVVIMLGTNDTKPQNWQHFKTDFEADLKELAGQFAALPAKPRLYICCPPYIAKKGNFGISETNLMEALPVVKKVARELKLGLIDVHGALQGKDGLLPDNVHPNTEGATVIAQTVYRGLTGQAAPAPLVAPKDMVLFLLIGQSNMAGRGAVQPQDRELNPRVFMFNEKNLWVPARDPVHFDKPGAAGVGLCSEFARTLLKKDPKMTVGLIPCAFGGTSLAEWMPGTPESKKLDLYRKAVARTTLAMDSGTLAGILWHQGESDTGRAAGYTEKFASMIAQLRKDLKAEKVPLILGELCNKNGFNQVIQKIPDTVPYSAWVSSEGCANDGLHFKREGYLLLGQRYAEKYFQLRGGQAGKDR